MKRILAAVFLALALLSPVNVLAAWVHVQSEGFSGTSSVPSAGKAFLSNVAAGSFIAVGGAFFDSTAPTSVVITDSLSTSYNCALFSVVGTEESSFICYGIATAGGANTVTVDPEGSAYISFGMAEFSNPDPTPLDADGGTSTGNGVTPSDSITTATADALIIGVMTVNAVGANAYTPGGSYIQISESENESGTQPFSVVYRIATAATSYTVDWSITNNRDYYVRTASFQVVTAAPPTKKRIFVIE